MFFHKDKGFATLRTALEALRRERAVFWKNYKVILTCILFQFVHNLASNVAEFLHVPQKPLYDLGHKLIRPLPENLLFAPDFIYNVCVLLMILVALTPFLFKKTSFSSVALVSRYFAVLVLAQSLRILTFLMTDLPGPSSRCKADADDPYGDASQWSMAKILWKSTFNFFSKDCGELIFSSKMVVVVLCALTVHKYGRWWWIKWTVLVLGLSFSVLMIAARREYSLSIFIAWYATPLIWFVYGRNFPDDDRLSDLQGVLPINLKEKKVDR